MSKPPYRILIVDDDEDCRALLEMILSNGEFEVASAGDATEAFELLKASPPQLIVTDLTLPEMSGEEFAQQLRARPESAQVPLVAMSGRDLDPQAADLFDKVLLKPFDSLKVAELLRTLLTSPRAPSPTPPPVTNGAPLPKTPPRT